MEVILTNSMEIIYLIIKIGVISTLLMVLVAGIIYAKEVAKTEKRLNITLPGLVHFSLSSYLFLSVTFFALSFLLLLT